MIWRAVSDVVGPNSVSKAFAVLSGFSIILPWLVLKNWSVNASPGELISVAAPYPFFSMMQMAAAYFGFFSIPSLVSIASLVFIAGAVVSWWSPVGGILQAGSVYTLAISLVQNDYILLRGTIEAEYGFGIGFHVGFIFALVTVFSLCPSGRNVLMEALRAAFSQVKS